MIHLLVWSEIPEPNAPTFEDCWASAYLQGLVKGGFSTFPLGIYTTEEREAFERSQTLRPPETGGFLATADAASRNRYFGIVLRATFDYTALTRAIGVYFAITGHDGFGTAGNHAMGAIPIDSQNSAVYNPLAANKSEPTIVATSSLIAWIQRGLAAGLPQDYRIVVDGELAFVSNFNPTSPTATCDVAATTVYADLLSKEPLGPVPHPAMTGVEYIGDDVRPPLGSNYPPLPVAWINTPEGLGIVAKAAVSNIVVPPVGGAHTYQVTRDDGEKFPPFS